MTRYVCNACGYVYDPVDGAPENGVAFGTRLKDLHDDWLCSGCGSPKSNFEAELSSKTAAQKFKCGHAISFWKKIIAPRKQEHSACAGK